MSSTIFTDLDPAEAKKWADTINGALSKDIGNTVIIRPSAALDADEEPAAQPKTERMRDWKQK